MLQITKLELSSKPIKNTYFAWYQYYVQLKLTGFKYNH